MIIFFSLFCCPGWCSSLFSPAGACGVAVGYPLDTVKVQICSVCTGQHWSIFPNMMPFLPSGPDPNPEAVHGILSLYSGDTVKGRGMGIYRPTVLHQVILGNQFGEHYSVESKLCLKDKNKLFQGVCCGFTTCTTISSLPISFFYLNERFLWK